MIVDNLIVLRNLNEEASPTIPLNIYNRGLRPLPFKRKYPSISTKAFKLLFTNVMAVATEGRERGIPHEFLLLPSPRQPSKFAKILN